MSDTGWERLKALAAMERQSREELERLIARSDEDGELLARLARACVRDGKLVEALAHYDQAEYLGYEEAQEERRLVALHVGDFPEPGGDPAPRRV